MNHSANEYVKDMAHTNGIESFWATLKRGVNGTFHSLSVKHLQRYVNEFAGRSNERAADTYNQLVMMANKMDRKTLPYKVLTQ